MKKKIILSVVFGILIALSVVGIVLTTSKKNEKEDILNRTISIQGANYSYTNRETENVSFLEALGRRSLGVSVKMSDTYAEFQEKILQPKNEYTGTYILYSLIISISVGLVILVWTDNITINRKILKSINQNKSKNDKRKKKNYKTN